MPDSPAPGALIRIRIPILRLHPFRRRAHGRVDRTQAPARLDAVSRHRRLSCPATVKQWLWGKHEGMVKLIFDKSTGENPRRPYLSAPRAADMLRRSPPSRTTEGTIRRTGRDRSSRIPPSVKRPDGSCHAAHINCVHAPESQNKITICSSLFFRCRVQE